MPALQLNRFETEMAQRAEAAELCDFTGPEWRNENRIELRAEAIRTILMGLPVVLYGGSDEKVIILRGTGLKLKKPEHEAGIEVLQAHITGALDLDHACRADGGPLPHLSLLACVFEEAVSLRHARLRGLDLAGSHLSQLSAQHVVIEGSVDLSGIHAPDGGKAGMDGKGQCWVDFSGAKVESTFRAPGAKLVAPTVRSKDELEVETPHFALELDHTQIGGSLDLRNGFEADGGVTLELAIIGGHVRAPGARLTAGEGAALMAAYAQVRGGLDLGAIDPHGRDTIVTRIKGGISLLGAKIAGNLGMGGAHLDGQLFAQGVEVGGSAFLRAREGRKDGKAETIPFVAKAEISLSGAKITGQLVMTGAQLDEGLNAQRTEIGGGAYLCAWEGHKGDKAETFPFVAKAEISLLGAKITGQLAMDGAHLEGGLFAQNAEIGGSAHFRAWEGHKDDKADTFLFVATTEISLSSAKITGPLDMSGAHLEGRLFAQGAEIGGGVFFCAFEGRKNDKAETFLFTAGGEISFADAKITSVLDMSGARIEGRLFAQGVEIGGNAFLCASEGCKDDKAETFPFFAKAEISLAGVKITGNLEMNGARLEKGMNAQSAEIGGHAFLRAFEGRKDDKAETFLFTAMGRISLASAKIAGNLEMLGAQLEGELFAQNTEVGGAVLFRTYNGHKNGRKKTFPFFARRRLWLMGAKIASQLEMSGARLKSGFNFEEVEAGRVSDLPSPRMGFQMRRREFYATLGVLLLVCIYLCWIVGTNEVRRANGESAHDRSVMVLDTGTIATTDTPVFKAKLPPVLAPGEKPCGDAIDPRYYALDLFVPLLDLHQESRCTLSSAKEAAPWRLAALIYQLLGWVMTSCLIWLLSSMMKGGRKRAQSPD